MNRWQEHVKKTRAEKPGLSFKQALQEAKKTYKGGGNVPMLKGRGLEHARFASEVYKKPFMRKDVGGWKYKGGDDTRGFWESPTQVILAFRGTTTKEDVGTDIALGGFSIKKTFRYKRDLRFARQVLGIAKKLKKELVLTGHSLGGALATEIARVLHIKAVVYNAGFGPREAVRAKADKIACLVKPKGKKCRKAQLIEHERTFGDPVSILGRHGVKTKHIVPKKLNVHSIDNFEMLKD